jgi:hypothetical protein
MWPVVETVVVATNVDWFGVVVILATAIVTTTAAFLLHRFFRHALREM